MTSLSEKIDLLYNRALGDLETAAGDLSMCAIAKSGVPMPALKYHEGRVAMLRDVRNARRGDGISPVVLDTIRSRWEAKRALAELSRDWEAYLNGGEDVIADLGLI